MGRNRYFFKNIRDTKETFHAKIGTIKDKNGKDLTEAEEIKKWQEYIEELYKKDLSDPDTHDSGVTHLEPGILEYKVKWALGSIIIDKVGGDDLIPAELFQILKDATVKVLHSICQQYLEISGKLSNDHYLGKGQFSFQSQRRETLKNVQTTLQLCSLHMPAR